MDCKCEKMILIISENNDLFTDRVIENHILYLFL
jgi:hypothetical protein